MIDLGLAQDELELANNKCWKIPTRQGHMGRRTSPHAHSGASPNKFQLRAVLLLLKVIDLLEAISFRN